MRILNLLFAANMVGFFGFSTLSNAITVDNNSCSRLISRLAVSSVKNEKIEMAFVAEIAAIAHELPTDAQRQFFYQRLGDYSTFPTKDFRVSAYLGVRFQGFKLFISDEVEHFPHIYAFVIHEAIHIRQLILLNQSLGLPNSDFPKFETSIKNEREAYARQYDFIIRNYTLGDLESDIVKYEGQYARFSAFFDRLNQMKPDERSLEEERKTISLLRRLLDATKMLSLRIGFLKDLTSVFLTPKQIWIDQHTNIPGYAIQHRKFYLDQWVIWNIGKVENLRDMYQLDQSNGYSVFELVQKDLIPTMKLGFYISMLQLFNRMQDLYAARIKAAQTKDQNKR